MIKPFAHSVTVADIPADEAKRPSGLYVAGETTIEHERGMIIDVAADDCPHTAQLKRGDIIFYKLGGCAQIGDVKIVPEDYIIAFEPTEAD